MKQYLCPQDSHLPEYLLYYTIWTLKEHDHPEFFIGRLINEAMTNTLVVTLPRMLGVFQGPGERSIDAETIPNYRNGMTKRKIDFQNNNTSVIGSASHDSRRSRGICVIREIPSLIPLRSIRNDVPYVDAFPTTSNTF
ncbi:hypothetical protein [Niabella ginsenosidivorans]|uniref:hypothetical protein n=1 Tax=Niabella ginsenosidivorans TaxID=1176587 RepID=UPI0012EDC5DF|nr:hypothetical protein [Niabella ginsenosidivorans]